MRDGREVPFDRKRIERAVRRAQDVAGEDDPPFAEEVADVVALTLQARYLGPSRPFPQAGGFPRTGSPTGFPQVGSPTVGDVQDLLEQALIEMGRAPVAKAYILHRDRRERARQALTITERPSRGGPMPWVRDGGGTSAWNPVRIVAALMQEADLPREIAEEVAERVEARVFDSGLRRLSTSLIREFVDNELMAMGLETALHRQEPVGIPRHDLRELLTRPRPPSAGSGFGAGRRGADADRWGADPPALDGALAEALLSRYSLADVFDERTADLHKSGAIHIQGAERPHQVLSCSVPAELLLAGEPTAHSGFLLVSELAGLLNNVSQGLVLEGLHSVVAPLCRSSRASAGLRDLLTALGAVGRAAGRRLDLAAPGGRSATLAGRLVREL
ncbi:MAG: ATP cone domain-containing protein, partial [Planctomycetota bacterium]